MNCANHPDLPVSAYCQNCGKPLCTQCVRSVAGVVYCEPCLAARLNPGGAAAASTSDPAGSAGWTRVQDPAAYSARYPRAGAATNPALAGFLGAIPGVGAMYNGQFVKAFAHVVIFVVLISVAEHFDAAGLLVAAWIFYQIFDAVQTAIARRDGRPLPDPFGLNDLGQRLGMPAATAYPTSAPPVTGVPTGSPDWTGQTPVSHAASSPAAQAFVNEAPVSPPPMPDPSSPEYQVWAQRMAAEQAMRDAGMPLAGGGYQPIAAPLPVYPVRSEPVGAIVLIGVGVLFLLSTLGIFRWDWIGRGWPLLIILIGAGLLFSRARSMRRMGGGL